MTREALHILLVEDNPIDARATLKAAERLQIVDTIDVVTSGDEALDYLRGDHESARRPDLVLLDLNLPGTDGRGVLARVKADPELRRVPIVVLTTSSDEADVVGAYDLGANAYVTKPVDLDGWERAIGQIEGFWLSLAQIPRR
ncbi:MAG: response regulator [Acidimicrobiales bacterium]